MEKKKKILIFSSYIYPRISPRAMRATELAKEFARQGHEVVLYGMLGEFDYTSFKKEHNIVIKPFPRTYLYKETSCSPGKYTILDRVLIKLFRNLFDYPSIELTRATFKALKNEDNVDLIITVAHPFSLHWGVALFRQKFPKRLKKTTWVADCGDPFMGNPIMKRPFYFKYIEKWFSRKTDYISIPVEEAISAYYSEFHNKIKIIPQGFNFDVNPHIKEFMSNKVPTFMYAGKFYDQIRDPRPLLDFLSSIEKEFKLVIRTKDVIFVDSYREILKDKLVIKDYVSREDLLLEMSQMDFLINYENNTNIQSPSKLIDYALAKRPILNLNSNKPLDSGVILEFLNGNYKTSMQINNIEKYDIKNVSKQFLDLTKLNHQI